MCRAAMALIVLLCGFAMLASAALGPSIEGRVLNLVTNEPVPNAEVKLTCVKLSRSSRFCRDVTGKTASDGTFSFNRLFPVTYSVMATGAAGLVATRKSQVQVGLEQTYIQSEVILKLEPESEISGRTLNVEGQPSPQVQVMALKQVPAGNTIQLKPVAVTVSDQKGGYTLHKIAPGNYYVARLITQPNNLTPQSNTLPTDKQPPDKFLLYAPSAFSLEDAVAIHVDRGQSYANNDIRMRPLVTYRIQGRAQMETPDQVISGDLELHLSARDSSGVVTPDRELTLAPDGSFEANVLPGLYTLRLMGTTSLAQAVTQAPASKKPPAMMVHLLAKQDVEISGRGVYGILLFIPPPSTINGSVRMERTEDAQAITGNISLRPVDLATASACPASPIEPDGTFKISQCDAADYAVKFIPPAGTYIKSMRFNDRDALSQPIDLSKYGGGNLSITLRPGGGSVSLTVQDATLESGTKATNQAYDVVLIPDSWTPNGLVPVIHVAAQNGKYLASDLAPGHYTAIADTTVDPQFWENAAFVHQVRSGGTPIDLAEGERKELVVTLLTEDEVSQIEMQLGLY